MASCGPRHLVAHGILSPMVSCSPCSLVAMAFEITRVSFRSAKLVRGSPLERGSARFVIGQPRCLHAHARTLHQPAARPTAGIGRIGRRRGSGLPSSWASRAIRRRAFARNIAGSAPAMAMPGPRALSEVRPQPAYVTRPSRNWLNCRPYSGWRSRAAIAGCRRASGHARTSTDPLRTARSPRSAAARATSGISN
jgi:hypothetical protein